MLIKKDYCDYDTCVALEELGFPLEEDYGGVCIKSCVYKKPSLYKAQKWLREEKGIIVCPAPYEDYKWCACIFRIKFPNELCKGFDTYEEALLEGIKEAVKFLKEKK